MTPKSKQRKQNNPDTILENALLKKGLKYIIGIDEAGRGAWAGPVAVGGYMFSIDSKIIPDVKDSKLLSAKKRDELYEALFEPICSFVEFGEVEQINEFGISNTITTLINKIITKTYQDDIYYLIDGVFKENFTKNCQKIIKGDLMHYSISCASILAKVSRDRVMCDLAKQFPGFAFDLNKGYGTKKHQDALKIYGISKIHRLNYKPIVLINKSNEERNSKHARQR
jgi:ribonuclease HII